MGSGRWSDTPPQVITPKPSLWVTDYLITIVWVGGFDMYAVVTAQHSGKTRPYTQRNQPFSVIHDRLVI